MPQCSLPPGAAFLRACLHALLWSSAVVVLQEIRRGARMWAFFAVFLVAVHNHRVRIILA